MEVVLALGVFAGGVLVLMGLLSPLIRSVQELTDGSGSSMAKEAILNQLTELEWDQVRSSYLLNAADISGLHARDNRRFFVSRQGARVSKGGESDALTFDACYYEALLIRCESLSSPSTEASSGVLTFFIELSWPAMHVTGETILREQRQRRMVTTSLRR